VARRAARVGACRAGGDLRVPGTHAATLAEFARLQADALRPGIGDAERVQARRDLEDLVRRVQADARAERVLDALHSPRQLEASLVEVWFNHFNVFARKETVRVTAGFYEREAIRPHVLGRFRDLLGATARHPAMLNYLDNWQSVVDGFRPPPGVPRPAGFTSPRGLNENYARELLELHTLGVDGGYTQADVTELARIFTGWSFDRRAAGTDDAFRFYPARHDPGPKTLLGQRAPGGGVRDGEWALDRLARHPSTARHVARRLALAYVADVPPPALVDRLAARYLQTDGDLREVVRALATSPEFTIRPTGARSSRRRTTTCCRRLPRALDPATGAHVDSRAPCRAIRSYGDADPRQSDATAGRTPAGHWAERRALRLRVESAVALAPRARRPIRPVKTGADAGGDPEAGLPATVAAALGSARARGARRAAPTSGSRSRWRAPTS
jgi:hypothetical protein